MIVPLFSECMTFMSKSIRLNLPLEIRSMISCTKLSDHSRLVSSSDRYRKPSKMRWSLGLSTLMGSSSPFVIVWRVLRIQRVLAVLIYSRTSVWFHFFLKYSSNIHSVIALHSQERANGACCQGWRTQVRV